MAGGVVAGASVGGDTGSTYQTKISAKKTAAAIISTLFVSIAPPPICPAKEYRAPRIRTRLAIPGVLNENHKCAPDDHGNFGDGRPFGWALVFVCAAENSEYCSEDVREWAKKNAKCYDIG